MIFTLAVAMLMLIGAVTLLIVAAILYLSAKGIIGGKDDNDH